MPARPLRKSSPASTMKSSRARSTTRRARPLKMTPSPNVRIAAPRNKCRPRLRIVRKTLSATSSTSPFSSSAARTWASASSRKSSRGSMPYASRTSCPPWRPLKTRLERSELTEVMETKQGYLVLQVLEHYDEGEQALAKVKNEIMDKLYSGRMEPAMREYLKTLREQSYVVIKPGFQDIAGGSGSEIQEVSATPEVTKSKKGHKKFLLFGKRSGSASAT